MVNIIIAFQRPEECTSIRNILARSGYRSLFICYNGAQAISQAEDLDDGIVVCGYKLPDMVYGRLRENLPMGFQMLLLAPQKYISECYANDIVCLSMPFKVDDFINSVGMLSDELARRKRRARLQPRERSDGDVKLIAEAKELLMSRNHMNEDEAHRYLQKNSMDSGNSLVDTAKMVLSMFK